jgi:predicted nucleic acid-binding protein
MNPPQVLIERTAIDALCDATHEHHQAVATAFVGLLDDFEADRLLLVAVSDHLRTHREWSDFARRGPLAPVDTLHVGHQHRRAARRMDTVPDFDAALTLVMCQRHKVARVLTLDPQYAAYDLDVLVVGDGDDVRV